MFSNIGENFVKGIVEHVYQDLLKKGVDPAKIGAKVEALAAELAPLAEKFELDLPQLNQIFFKGKLSDAEIAKFETAIKEAVEIAGEVEPVIEEIEHLAGH